MKLAQQLLKKPAIETSLLFKTILQVHNSEWLWAFNLGAKADSLLTAYIILQIKPCAT